MSLRRLPIRLLIVELTVTLTPKDTEPRDVVKPIEFGRDRQVMLTHSIRDVEPRRHTSTLSIISNNVLVVGISEVKVSRYR